MLSPANGEQVHLVNYVEDYLDSIESLPFDLQRSVSLMREIDAKYQGTVVWSIFRRRSAAAGAEGAGEVPGAPAGHLPVRQEGAGTARGGGSVDTGLRGGSLRDTCRCAEILKELDEYYEKFKRETDGVQKRRVLHCIQRALIRSQELGDEKIQIVSQMVELVENRTRQVDSHVELFEAHQEVNDATGHSGKAGQDKSKSETITQAEKTNNKRSRRQRNNENRENAANNHDHDDITSGTPKEKKAKASKKKKRSKAKAEREASPADLPIDPNEPTYCLCNQVSYGEMIGCDNDECPIEWFHFSCVGLNHKPKGKWYCPKCRGENEKTMDKALEKSKKERAHSR
ncbi:inhibitor of growth protein 1 isoform X1 [Enhydra lutris kenyoni]|uniref:Inhibitor of growth protein n=1 Tax=Enhydra lutris kenyoni TaxID=391180 RepID=A0A2Y9JCD8_ENHLU|nr:inhibitor of growth protein 1 isoform X1 [Enhydra lutris kenyoni]